MLSKKEQYELRNQLFRHLDGIGTAPSAYTLYEKGVIKYIKEHGSVTLQEAVQQFGANEGYLNVALRIMASQGWLEQGLDNKKDALNYQMTTKGEYAFDLIPLYEDVVELLRFSEKFHARKFDIEPFNRLAAIFDKYKNSYGLKDTEDEVKNEVQQQVLAHIEGIIVGPTVVRLGMSGMFHKYFMEASFRPEEFHSDAESFRRLLDIFVDLDWFKKTNGTYQFTEKGLFYARRASAYGVTVSYIPTFRKLDELIFGDPNYFSKQKGVPEEHVDREMNVWGSGGAHSAYFKVVDEIIIDMFNRPIAEQPKGILDMGCGNGAFLKHIFDVIEKQTSRGKMLDEHPLFLVGADYNEAALDITKSNLIAADIWAKIIWGDIGRPDLLAKDLQENYGIDIKDLLNVRTFLDHNRIWEEPDTQTQDRHSKSTGAFATKGKRLSNNLVEESLLVHFKKWAPFVKKFGLLVIELHTIPPHLAAQNLGQTAVTAYDATHGYSDQYIVEVEVFHKIAQEAGLTVNQDHFKKFPDGELATVSINLLEG
ncbi:class I SAM-dependent methyltransferase [Fulvivirga sp. RKSG066]|uniref:class I SAM-dependent methyltransferase n=1 Tax=Fulvivirga aurantia TaxID=2529383 RepID=UPI0012BCED37|nr:class I SAM-dependent methyltransferase [Fulvivirga aurantia]MTI21815.1 class I SAM-dependent methyltransferase [Fulvivirga aurantia]